MKKAALGCKGRSFFQNRIFIFESCTHIGELQLFSFPSDSEFIWIISYISKKIFYNVSIIFFLLAVALRLNRFERFKKTIERRKNKVKYTPEKIFISANNGYVEISYQEFCNRCRSDASFEEKYFLPLYGMLLEVPKEVYTEFYKDRRRQKYLMEQSANNGDFSYDMLTTEEFNGEDILPDPKADVTELVERKIMLDMLQESLSLLTQEEQELLHALFFLGLSEREWSAKTGVPQRTINHRKRRILGKLKKYIEK